ncbi:MAG: hypothetical protein WC615_16035 [Mucilaginibacter sp.]|jgi:hypothetical protein|uniref:hypothetical protein n=1 Tax=Mucilaginibacter sp. TaxID=1882438 RepID=UPI0035649216
MDFNKMASAIFEGVPEFRNSYDDELDEEAPYSFLSAFGVFVRDSIVNKKPCALSALTFINHFVNNNVEDDKLMEMMVVGVLEILTDYAVTQKEASKNFTGHCYKFFDELLTGGFFLDLRQINY